MATSLLFSAFPESSRLVETGRFGRSVFKQVGRSEMQAGIRGLLLSSGDALLAPPLTS